MFETRGYFNLGVSGSMLMNVGAGITRRHAEGGSTDRFPWRSTSLGENSGEDGRCWSIAEFPEAKDRRVGKRRRLERK